MPELAVQYYYCIVTFCKSVLILVVAFDLKLASTDHICYTCD